MSQKELIKWFIDDYMPFDDYEKSVLEEPQTDHETYEFGNEPEFCKPICIEFDRFFYLMPFCNITSKTYRIEVADTGSYFIRELFKKYTSTDNTFVLSSTCEHDTTRECLSNVKNKLELYIKDIRSLNIDKIIEAYKTSKCNFFMMYMVGTSISSGEIIPQTFFELLKKRLEDEHINHILILDDVHGMFMTPRDYRIFDYILYTAHSLVCDYNMGMLISRNEYQPMGRFDWIGLERYYHRLQIILEKEPKLRLFKQILSQYFAEELSDTKFFGLHEFTSQHIFSLKTYNLKFSQRQWDKLNEYKIRLGEGDWYQNFARIRFQEFIRQDSDKMIEGLELLKKTLKICKKVYLESEG